MIPFVYSYMTNGALVYVPYWPLLNNLTVWKPEKRWKKNASIILTRSFFIAILFWAVAIVGYAAENLHSPDGKYNFVFEQKDGKLKDHLDYAGKKVIEEGEWGVNIYNHLVEAAMGIPVDTNWVWTTGMEEGHREPPIGLSCQTRQGMSWANRGQVACI